jgi:hypothetical protein
MSDHVTITRQAGAKNASFNTISLSLSQLVFWKNQDNEAHWPVFSGGSPPPSLKNQVGPNSTSDSLLPGLALSKPPAQGVSSPVSYKCSLPQHEESGTINVYADFFSQPSQLSVAQRGVKYDANLTTGGLQPFKFNVSNSNLPASLKVTIVNANQGPAVSGTPGANDAGSFAFDLVCEDSDGNNITQTYLLTVS